MKTYLNTIAKRITSKHPEMSYCRNILFKAPVENILAGFCFEQIKKRLYLWLFFQPLFIPHEHLYFTFGERLKNRRGSSILIFDHSPEETTKELEALIEDNIETVFYLSNTQRFYDHFNGLNKSFNTFRDLAFTKCFLKEHSCDESLEGLIEAINKSSRNDVYWMQELLRQTKLLKESSDNEKIQIFNDWRDYSIHELGLSRWDNET